MSAVQILDGPLGTELERRGIALPLPAWSALAVMEAPESVAAIHRDYAAAGAQVHTAATFRTTPRGLVGSAWHARWRDLAARAVRLCRENVGEGLVAGSMAPLEDCYHPERTPAAGALRQEHDALARCLAEAGVDLLLVETMPTQVELVAATRAAAATGRPVWAAITLGPRGDFFDEQGVLDAAEAAAGEGAQAFLLNCTASVRITPLLERLGASARRPARLGAFANVLFDADDDRDAPEGYARQAARWHALGATILGGCCGTTPEHVRALSSRLVEA